MNTQPEDYPRKADLDQPTRFDLLTLCERVCDGLITSDEFDRLEAMLRESEQARLFYIEYVGGLHGTLRWMAARDVEQTSLGQPHGQVSGFGPPVFPPIDLDQELPNIGSTSPTHIPFPSLDGGAPLTQPPDPGAEGSTPSTFLGLAPYKWFALSWVVLLFCAAAWVWLYESDAPAVGDFATLTQMEGCVWAADRMSPQHGERLGEDDGIELVGGVAEIEFDNGTRMVLEGPAQLSFEGPDRVACNRGSLVAIVPAEAIGFTVRTPLASVVDLGTEFGVVVEASGESEVHVFQGVVRLKASSGGNDSCVPPIELSQGESRRVDLDGIISTQVRLHPSSFVRSGVRKVSHRQVVVSTERGRGADSYIHSLKLYNHGNDPSLGVKATYKATTRRKAWLRFDIADPTLSASQLSCASLQLTIAEPRRHHSTVEPNKRWDFAVWGLKDVRHGVPWDGPPGEGGWFEGTGRSSAGRPVAGTTSWISWTNAGGNDVDGNGLQKEYFEFLGKFQIQGEGVEGRAIRLSTSALRDFVADDSNGLVTLVVLRATPQPHERESTIHWFASKEHGKLPPPQLKLDFDF